MIDVVEVSYRLVKVKQQKYACRCGGCVETAPGPERAIAGGRYSLDFAIKVALDKYLDHIPLARQERILRRHGLVVTSQTLWDQVDALGRRLTRSTRRCSSTPSAQSVIGLDQTAGPASTASQTSPGRCGASPRPASSCTGFATTKAPTHFGHSSATTTA